MYAYLTESKIVIEQLPEKYSARGGWWVPIALFPGILATPPVHFIACILQTGGVKTWEWLIPPFLHTACK